MNLKSILNFKRRIYRFCDDLILHIFAEQLEEKMENGIFPSIDELHLVSAFLNNTKKTYHLKAYVYNRADSLISILNKKMQFESNYSKTTPPSKVIHIIGSPRSGTSYLFNILCYQKQFAYFSSISHFIWSSYNHVNRQKVTIEESTPETLLEDTKALRLSPKLALPSESEDIFNRSIKVYDHIQKHEYALHDALVYDVHLLKQNIEKHTFFQRRNFFLSKSPFNSFRIPELMKAYDNTYFIHIYRNGYHTINSIMENKFKYFHPSIKCKTSPSALDFWRLHIMSILNNAPIDRTIHLSYEELMKNQEKTIRNIFERLEISIERFRLPNNKNYDLFPIEGSKGNKDIDEIHALLGALN